MLHLLWLSLAVPVVVHLVHRRKARQVPFSTLRFLRMVDRRVARRHRLRELLLLAIRVLVLAAVVGALYRPMIRSDTFKGVGVPTAVAVLLDNTYSMQASAQGMLRFDRARSAAVEIVAGLEHGDSVCVVPFAGVDGAQPDLTTALGRQRDELDAMTCGYGTADVAGPLRRALDALARSNTPRKELYVITDFQHLSWTEGLAEVKGDLPDDVPVFMVDVGSDVGTNLSLTGAEFGLGVQVTGAASEIYCTLRNTGRLGADRELALYLDGRKAEAQQAVLAAGAESTIAFRHVFSQTGALSGRVELASDELGADNARYFVTDVQEALDVLLVNGDPSAVPHMDETFFLELALRAPSPTGQNLSPVRPRTVPAADLQRERLDDFACVILANVPRLDDLSADRLRRYVSGGGGLIIFAGDRVDPAAYNTAFAPAGEDPLLPALLEEMRQKPDPDDAFGIKSVAVHHPVFRGIGDQIDTGPARVDRFLSVTPHPGGAGGAALMELDGGPLLLEQKAGAGTVLLCTTSADLDWSNLPARRFFLPMVHQMVYYVSRSALGAGDVQVGMPLVLELPPEAGETEVAFYGPTNDDDPLAVITSAPADGVNRASFAGTGRPGIYTALYEIEGGRRERRFAVNVDAAESEPARIEPEDAAEALGAQSVVVVRDLERLGREVRRERAGLPLWDHLFALAVVLAVAECYMANVVLKQ